MHKYRTESNKEFYDFGCSYKEVIYYSTIFKKNVLQVHNHFACTFKCLYFMNQSAESTELHVIQFINTGLKFNSELIDLIFDNLTFSKLHYTIHTMTDQKVTSGYWGIYGITRNHHLMTSLKLISLFLMLLC